MEIKQTLIACYSQKGDDSWDDERIINNLEELFQYMKDLYRTNAPKYSDLYPFNGYCKKENFSFVIRKSVEIESDIYSCDIKTENPFYFEKAFQLYEIFYTRVRNTLPNLKKASQKRIKEQQERNDLKKLTIKYNKL